MVQSLGESKLIISRYQFLPQSSTSTRCPKVFISGFSHADHNIQIYTISIVWPLPGHIYTYSYTQLFFSSTPVKSSGISRHCHFLLISFLLGDGLSATKKLLDSGALRAVLDATNKIYNTASQRKVRLAAQMKQDSKLQNLVKQLAWFMVNICRQTENMDLSQEDVKDIYRAIAMFVNDTDNLEVSHRGYSIQEQQQLQGLGR